MADPLVEFCERRRVGDVLSATVTQVTSVGTFALADGVESIVHGAREDVTVGQSIDVIVADLDFERRRVNFQVARADR